MNDQSCVLLLMALYGGGQFWQKVYDPFDPLALTDAHAPIPKELQTLVMNNEAVPILICQALFILRVVSGLSSLRNWHEPECLVYSSFLLKEIREASLLSLAAEWQKASGSIRRWDHCQWRDVHVHRCERSKIAESWRPLKKSIMNKSGFPSTAFNHSQHARTSNNSCTEKECPTTQTYCRVEFRKSGLSFYRIFMHSIRARQFREVSYTWFFCSCNACKSLILRFSPSFAARKRWEHYGARDDTYKNYYTLYVGRSFPRSARSNCCRAYGIPLLSYAARTGITLPGAIDNVGFALEKNFFQLILQNWS